MLETERLGTGVEMKPSRDQKIAYLQSYQTCEDLEACFMRAVEVFGVPYSLLDVGCGCGHIVKLARTIGANPSTGVDICVDADEPSLYNHDLRTEWISPNGPADMVLCLEVAEHLPASSAEVLCATLSKNTLPGGILLFSAAVPGQGGAGHLNERPHSFWRGLLRDNFVELDLQTKNLRQAWMSIAPRAWWYGQNLVVFRKR
jgi:SAM-dependent methyltransferase